MPMGLLACWTYSIRKEMPDLFSLDQIIAIIGAAAVVITAVAKASDSILAWLKFKKEQKNRAVSTFGEVDRL